MNSIPTVSWLRLVVISAGILLPATLIEAAAQADTADDAPLVKIVNVATGKVLGIENDSGEVRARVVLAKDEQNESRQWQIVKEDDSFKIVNRKSGNVLDIQGDSKDAGANINQYT